MKDCQDDGPSGRADTPERVTRKASGTKQKESAGALRDTSRMENESRSGCQAGQDDQGRCVRGAQSKRQDDVKQDAFEGTLTVRSQEKLSRMSREHQK